MMISRVVVSMLRPQGVLRAQDLCSRCSILRGVVSVCAGAPAARLVERNFKMTIRTTCYAMVPAAGGVRFGRIKKLCFCLCLFHDVLF